jgi:hypothetical protein
MEAALKGMAKYIMPPLQKIFDIFCRNDTQHNDILHNGLICLTQYNVILRVTSKHCYASMVMLSVVMLSVVMLSVVMLSVVMLSVDMLSVVMLSVGKVNVSLNRVIMLNVGTHGDRHWQLIYHNSLS